MIGAFLTGFATGLSLIVAIGAQNAFMLRQGLLRAHVLPLLLLFALSDAILISLGVAGFGAAVHLVPALPRVFSIGGAIFLAIYGALRFRTAMLGDGALTAGGEARELWPTLAIGAAFTWLNPHVYLDTLALMGAVSSRFTGLAAKVAFAAGGTVASFFFFSVLGYGARFLAPLLQSRNAWRVLDLLIAITMWLVAASLVTAALR